MVNTLIKHYVNVVTRGLVKMIADKYQLRAFLYLINNSSKDELETMLYMIEGLKGMKYGN